MNQKSTLSLATLLLSLTVATPSMAALVGRDLDGNNTTAEAYYDTVLGITWLANANAAVGSTFDTYTPGSGLMTWQNAHDWAAQLDFDPTDGKDEGWRLPNTTPVNGSAFAYDLSTIGATDVGYNITAPGSDSENTPKVSELSYMYYNTLRNFSLYDPTKNNSEQYASPAPTPGLVNTDPFTNIFAQVYWSESQATNANSRFRFNFGNGLQGTTVIGDHNYAWAVHDGMVGNALVPLPGAVWLFGSGLLGLFGARRCKRRLS